MTEKWEKKITKIQAEMSKTKSQMDGLNLKNVSLREKISNASTYRDQVSACYKYLRGYISDASACKVIGNETGTRISKA